MCLQEELEPSTHRTSAAADFARPPASPLRSHSTDLSKQLASAGMQPHTAYQACLDMWLPFLASEADHAATCLLLYDVPLARETEEDVAELDDDSRRNSMTGVLSQWREDDDNDEEAEEDDDEMPARQKSMTGFSPSNRQRSLRTLSSMRSASGLNRSTSTRPGSSAGHQKPAHAQSGARQTPNTWGLPVMRAALLPEARKTLGSLLGGLKTDFLSLVRQNVTL